MLTIEDLSFDIADATIQARLDQGQLLWNLSVETVAKAMELAA